MKKRLRVEHSIRIDDGFFSRIPPELFPHILKFLSSEVPFIIIICLISILYLKLINSHGFYPYLVKWQDLVSCSSVCRFLNFASSDESLWRRLSVISFT